MRSRQAFQAPRTTVAQCVCCKLICTYCILGGVDLSSTETFKSLVIRGNVRGIIILFIRIILAVIVCLHCMTRMTTAVRRVPVHPTPSDIFLLIYECFTCLTFFEGVTALWSNQESLKEMILHEEHSCHICIKRTLVWVVFTACFTCVLLNNGIYKQNMIMLRSHSVLAQIVSLADITRVYIWQMQCIVFLFFLLVPQIIKCRLQELEHFIDAHSPVEIAERRASIRRLTQNFNSHFGRLLFFFYVKIFAGAYICMYMILLSRGGTVTVILQGLNPLVVMAIFFDMAATGTAIIDMNYSIEELILSSYRYKMNHNALWRFAQRMAYDEVRDSLRISDNFINQKSALFGFCETLLTSLAILLQFDYQLMAKFDHGENSAPQNATTRHLP